MGDNLTRSTKNYDKMLEDENLPEEELNKQDYHFLKKIRMFYMQKTKPCL